MQPVPLPHQIVGGQFLANGGLLLADEPRVGKTGAAILALDFLMARRVLVVTTASGRFNFGREVREWQAFPRQVQVLMGTIGRVQPQTDVAVVGWSTIGDAMQREHLAGWRPELVVLDESHYAKSFEAKRTVAAMDFAAAADRTFCLSGTPMPNSPLDLWPMLKTLAPERVSDLTFDQFMGRYCVVRRKFVAGAWKPIVKRGKNEAELRQRLDGLWLRRTQQDVGIRAPIYATLALDGGAVGSAAIRAALADIPDADEILDAAETGDTRTLEQHLGTLRRVTGIAKAHAVAELVREEIESGKMQRVVLMCWHTGAIEALQRLLKAYKPVVLDGSTPAARRAAVVEAFQANRARVFIGQITAAGEAIDLSVSRDLIFVEQSFAPKDMKQAALRITNHAQKQQCLVRVAALAGSIDEALTAVLVRKIASIKEVLQ
ncbi:DEAD/DEAH box helicase [Methylobacterium brachiatum]|uniref:SNF2-related protein n=1 Tax=Methylobacterium brachiatum TaxID=269660 RepID=UPI0008EF1977|nr:DEAD/DEAH box helicase [Methylobacterium brachiatum]SFI05130.1 Helicase conserved C-terminal domain-containing protein [Methylobacterium brachiatum]